jgi:hypothetical protein
MLGGIGVPTPGLIRYLQRTAGNSSTAAFIRQAKVASASPLPGSPKSEVQRRVDLDKFLGENSGKLKEYGLSIDDLKAVQTLLADGSKVTGYLVELKTEMERHFPESQMKYTRALGRALSDIEGTWMKTASPKDVEVIPATSGQEPNEVFLQHLRSNKPLKDVGAALSHGEHAHRIQWFVIAKWAKQPEHLNKLYRAMNELLPEDALQFGNIESLWSAVLDVPGQHPLAHDVDSAAPVKLTNAISKGEKVKFSQLQVAILNRRLKRYLQVGAYWGLLRAGANFGGEFSKDSRGWRTEAQANKNADDEKKRRAAQAFLGAFPYQPGKEGPFGRTDTSFLDERLPGVEAPAKALVDSYPALLSNGQILGYDARNALALSLAGVQPSESYVRFCLSKGGEPLKMNKSWTRGT